MTNPSTPQSQDAILKMIKRVLQFVPDGICPYCKRDVLQGKKIDENTEIITCCPHYSCRRSYLD